MNQLISNFSQQLRAAMVIGTEAIIKKTTIDIKEVLVSGLGGSGIGANLVQEFVADQLKIPFIVNKDYTLPSFVGKHTLVIISSYSGNTEETLAAMKVAIARKAHIVCITSGGEIAKLAKKNRIDCILIPGGMPPRSCLGYSFVQQLYILQKLGLITNNFEKEILSAIKLIDKEEKEIIKLAQNIASKIYDSIPVIYSVSGNEAVAVRFRQQVNENGKQLCWHHVIPEMNHNELVGWREKNDKLAVIIFRTKQDNPRSQVRIGLNKKVFKKYTKQIIEIWGKGNSFLENAIYQIHLGDWISWFLSEERNFDCTEVDVINWLKSELSKK